MKMTNFKSLPNVFGIFLGLILVCLLGASTGLNAQTSYGLPILKPKAEIFQIADQQLQLLAEERKQSCTVQDPNAPCVKRIFALMEAYNHLKNYIQDMPWLDEYEVAKAVYPVTNVYNLTVVSSAVNMDGFDTKQYNPYFTEILLKIRA